MNKRIFNKKEFLQIRILSVFLSLNLLLFFGEFIYGFIDGTIAIMGDGLDSLGNAISYTIALAMIIKWEDVDRKKEDKSWLIGLVQLLFAIVIIEESVRRVSYGEHENFNYDIFVKMLIIVTIGLIINVAEFICFWKIRKGEENILSLVVFSAIDIGASLATIITLIVTLYTKSWIPDLVVGLLIFLLTLFSAAEIFVKYAKQRKNKIK